MFAQTVCHKISVKFPRSGTSLRLVFITNYILDKTISKKYYLLTNQDP